MTTTDDDRTPADGEQPQDCTDRDPGGGTRRSRRRVLQATVGLATLTALAGCSGSGSNGGDSSETDRGDRGGTQTEGSDGNSPEDGNGGPTETASTEGESLGSVGENTAEELVIVDWQSQSPGEIEAYTVDVTVRNTGGRETNLINYNLELRVFDDGDTEISGSYSGFSAVESTVAPGTEREFSLSTGVEGQLEDVARYEIVLNCDGADGVYC